MSVSAFQSRQIGALLGYALLEIGTRISQKDYVAASDLAYACHNLPSLQLGSDHFDWRYFRRWFTRFHELHGRNLFNYLAMLDAIEAETEVSTEVAGMPLGEITPIAHEFISLHKHEPDA
jgi:hypothetical protein